MKKLLFILFIFINFVSYSQENIERVQIGANLTKLIEIPDNIKLNEEFEIKLISGLTHDNLVWINYGKVIETPENLILKFTETGRYVPYINNLPQYKYTITIY